MRIFTKLIFLFLAFIPLVVQAQTVTIGSGTATGVLPINSYYTYSYGQQIILQNEINASGNITAIQFQTNLPLSSMTNSNGWTIYMGTTTQSSFASSTNWVPLAAMTQVYSGNVTFPSTAGWFTITLSTPFTYNNIDNLVIAVDENTTANNSTSTAAFRVSGTTSSPRGILYRSDTTNPDPSAPPTASFTYSYIPQMRLEGLTLQGCQAPTSPLVSGITATTANFAWTAATGGTASMGHEWKVVGAGAGSAGTAVSSGTTASGAVTASASSLSSSTSYDFYVRNNCSGSTNSGWAGPVNFATPCSTIALNVIQGFEAGTTIPTCWTSTFVSGTKAFSYGTTTSAAGTSPNPSAATGNNRLLFTSYSTSGSQTRLATPPIITTGTASVDVGFQWYHSTTGGAGSYLTEGVQVQYSTNGTTWTNAGSLILRYGATQGWFAKSITLPAAAGNQATLYVGFLFTSNAGYDSYMDDILIKPSPACVPPSALSVGTITQTGATLSWTASASAPTSYDIYYSTSSTAPIASTAPSVMGVTGNSRVLSGLSPSSTYSLWMRSACGGTFGNSDWITTPVVFVTPCGALGTINENFDNIITPNLPNCWVKVGTLGTVNTQTSTSNTAPNCLYLFGSASSSQPTIALPPVSNINANTHRLKFNLRANFTVGDVLQVGYVTDLINAATFTSFQEITATTLTYLSYTVDMGTTPPSGSYIAFRHKGNLGNSILVDDVIWDAKPLCPNPPSALAVSTITTSTATLSWTASPSNPPSYDIYYSNSATAPISTTAPTLTNVTGTSAALSGLSAATTYNVWMRSACGGTLGNSEWTTTSVTFSTPCSTLALNVTEGFESGTNIPACWTSTFISGTRAFSYGGTATAAGSSPNPTAFTGNNRLLFPSFSGSGDQTRFSSPPIATNGTSSVDVSFQWYHSTSGSATSYLTEGVQVQYSTNGTTWTNAGSLILRYDATLGWSLKTLTLPAAAGNQATLYVGFLFTSNAGYDSYIDDIIVKPTPICSGTPSAATISTSTALTCPGGSATLTATNALQAIGLSFVWQQSTDAGASWNNITGNPTTTPYVVNNISGNTQYRYYGTCSNSGVSTPSNVVSVSTTISVTAVTSTISVCSGGTTTNANLSLSGTVPTGVTYLWQVSTNGGFSYSNTTGANTSATYSAIVTVSSIFRCVINCGSTPVNSTSVSVNVTNCNYQAIYLPSGNTYVSIATTGLSAPFWLNPSSLIGDDNITTDLPLGFPFFFKGQTYTTLRACTNGFVSFTPGTTNVVYDNDMATGGPGKMLAPLWDDWVTQGNTAAALATSFKYQASGTAPNRVFTAEWIGMEQFLHAGPNINFQLVLHEGTNAFEYNYGTMEGFNGTVNKGDTYSIGITNTSSDYYALQSSRSNYFATINTNNITELPECNSAYAFILSPTNISGTAPAAVIPPNDNPSGAISVPVNATPCTSYCGTYFSAKNATTSSPAPVCAGTADDDVWFTFTATTIGAKISVLGSFGFNPRVELLSSTLSALQCSAPAPGDGLFTAFNSTNLTIGSTYYVRVYDDATGLGTNENGYFSICVSEYIQPPVNDECAGAITINAGVSCIPTTGSTVTATESLFITSSCNTPDDDLWYSFTALSTTPTINLQSGAGFNGAMQIFSGTCASLSSIACVNTGSTAVTETYTASNFTVGATYYVRAFHAVAGAATGNFSICVVEPTPPCPLKTAPSTASTNTPLSGNTLTWNSSVGASAYDVYLGTDQSLVSSYDLSTRVTPQGGITGLSFALANTLEYGTTYYWTVSARNTIGGSPSCSTSSFMTIPLPCPVKNTPLDAATLVAASGAILDWTAAVGASGATNYDVYFGISQASVASYATAAKIASSIAGLTYSLPPLAYGTTYYWTVSAKNGTGVASPTCTVFSFTTEAPPCPVKTAPLNAAMDLPLSGNTLNWTITTGASSYDVYFGTNQTLVASYDVSARIAINNTSTSFSLGTLAYATTYYWTISAKNNGVASPSCTVFSFTTQPQPPANDDPCNGTILAIGTQVCQNTNNAIVSSVESTSNLQTLFTAGGAGTLNHTVWYKYTPAVTNTYILKLSSPAGSTQIMSSFTGVYTTDCATTPLAFTEILAPVANNGAAGTTVTVTTPTLTAGTTYYFVASGNNNSLGDYCIQIDELCNNNSGVSPTMPTNTENILSQMCSDGGIYTYYGIPATNKYCLAIAWGTNTAAKTYAETNNTITMYKNASGNVIQGSGNTQTGTLDSYWNVDLGTNSANYLQNPVSVKFYFDPALYNALTTTISTYGTPTPITAFKTVGSQFSYTGSPSDATTGQWVGMTALTSSGLMTDANGSSFVELTGITSFSGGSIAVSSTVSSPLPISLKSFAAFEQGKINVVRWETATEKNVRTFLVEKSEDGKIWTKLGEILPSASKKYSLNDENPFVTTYYRLKNIDSDARIDVSNTVVVTRKSGKFALTNIAPNPTHDNIEVKFETTENHEVTLRILDIFGKEITLQKVDAQNGINAITVDMSSVVAGTYFVNINNGTSSLTKRISKI